MVQVTASSVQGVFTCFSSTLSHGGVGEDATLAEKFAALKEKKMHMVLPKDNPEVPWTALILGIWIPNFYYWGLNQYIMQRALGARTLAPGHRACSPIASRVGSTRAVSWPQSSSRSASSLWASDASSGMRMP